MCKSHDICQMFSFSKPCFCHTCISMGDRSASFCPFICVLGYSLATTINEIFKLQNFIFTLLIVLSHWAKQGWQFSLLWCMFSQYAGATGLLIFFFFLCCYTPPHDRGRVLWFHTGGLCVHLSICCTSVRIFVYRYNFSKCQWIFSKLGVCIDIVEIWWTNFVNFWQSCLPPTPLIFRFWMITWVSINWFSSSLVCALIWFGIANGQISSNFDSYLPATPDISFQDNNLSKGIFTKLDMCIGIVEIWFAVAIGYISSIFDIPMTRQWGIIVSCFNFFIYEK